MTEILILASITLLAAISPGPDMIVVIKNAIKSRKLGIATALGVGFAIFIHVGYCIAGVGIIISQSIILFSIIKTFGALYLLYIAYQLFRARKEEIGKIENTKNTHFFSGLKEGFITNILNPKATLFFLSVFTQVIEPQTSFITQGFYGIMMASIVCLWFITLSMIINIGRIQSHIASIQFFLNKAMGALLTFLSIKILLSQK